MRCTCWATYTLPVLLYIVYFSVETCLRLLQPKWPMGGQMLIPLSCNTALQASRTEIGKKCKSQGIPLTAAIAVGGFIGRLIEILAQISVCGLVVVTAGLGTTFERNEGCRCRPVTASAHHMQATAAPAWRQPPLGKELYRVMTAPLHAPRCEAAALVLTVNSSTVCVSA